MLLKHRLLIAWIVFIPCVSFAALPVMVYRVDSRPFSEIFMDGFYSWGGDHNLVAHVNGHTCSGPNSTSAFISTMTNYQSAMALAQLHVRERPQAFLYIIRPDYTFYNAAASVEYHQRYHSSSPLSISSLQMARDVGEWVAVNRILPENIVGVIEYRRFVETGVVEVGEVVFNPRYVDQYTTGNPHIFTSYMEPVENHFGFSLDLDYHRSTLLSACFAPCHGNSEVFYSKYPGLETCARTNSTFMAENVIALIFN